MKLKINCIPGEINIENTDKCEIIRCIYHFKSFWYDTYCLIRIFKFKSKIVVIASRLKGAILWDSCLIDNIINDFNLNYNNLY